MSYVANTLKFVFGTLPSKSILEWNDIEHFYPEIVAHKLNVAMLSKAGYTKSDCFVMMGTLQLISKRLQLAATNRRYFRQRTGLSPTEYRNDTTKS